MSITVPFRTTRPPRPDGGAAPPLPAPGPTLAVGQLELRSTARYLLVWAVGLFAVELLVAWSAYALLRALGVLGSMSTALSTVVGEPVPEGGVLPALEFGALLPWLLAVAGALALLWLLTVLAVVLVHNAVCALTGGPRLHVR